MSSTLIISTAEDLLAPVFGANKQILDIIAALNGAFNLALIAYGDPDRVDEYEKVLNIPANRIHILRFSGRFSLPRAILCGSLRSTAIRDFAEEHTIISRYLSHEEKLRLLVDGLSGAPLVDRYSAGTVISCHDCSSDMFRAEAMRAKELGSRVISFLRWRGATHLEERYLHRSEAVHIVKDEDGALLRAVNRKANCVTISLASGAPNRAGSPGSGMRAPRAGAILLWGDLNIGFAARGISQICSRLMDLDVTVLGSAQIAKFQSVVGDCARKFVYVDRVDDLDSFLSQFEIVVIPDDAGGGQKNRTLDAMRLGRCIVGLGAAFYGLPSLEQPYFVRMSSFDEVASSVRELAANRRCVELGRSAQDVFQARFSWESFRTKWCECIDSLAYLRLGHIGGRSNTKEANQSQDKAVLSQDQRINHNLHKVMKITILSMVYPPEPMVDGQTSSQLAEELAKEGHSVHVYAPFPNRPAGKLFNGYRRTLFSTSTAITGCRLTHCFNIISPKSTMLDRLAENLSFGVTAGLRLLCDERPDVIYSNTWPIIATGVVAVVAMLRRVPLVLSVQDVYPESLVSQKRIKNRGWCYKILRQCDQMISHSAKKVIVISSGFRELYERDRCVDPTHLHLVHNWSDERLFVEDPLAASLFRQKLGIPRDAFVAVCAGNLGVASDAEILVDAFARLKDRSNLYLLLAGDGSRLGACREKAERQQLDRVIIHSPWKTEETASVLQMADVLMLPTRGRQSLVSIPSKLIGYLLSARPVIAGVLPESDTAKIILETGGGWIIDPDSIGQMVEAISLASEESEESLNRMGTAGQRYAMQHLTRASNLPRVVAIVENAANKSS